MFRQLTPVPLSAAGIALRSVQLSLRNEEVMWKCCMQLLASRQQISAEAEIVVTACIKAVSFISTGRVELRSILGSGLKAALKYLPK